MAGEGIFDRLRGGVVSEEEVALKFLFPAKNKFEMLQMLADQQPRAIIPFSVLGVFRDKYKSKVLSKFQVEYNVNKIAQERKGRLEGSEVVVGVRRAAEREEE
jgi:hypothetical protein